MLMENNFPRDRLFFTFSFFVACMCVIFIIFCSRTVFGRTQRWVCGHVPASISRFLSSHVLGHFAFKLECSEFLGKNIKSPNSLKKSRWEVGLNPFVKQGKMYDCVCYCMVSMSWFFEKSSLSHSEIASKTFSGFNDNCKYSYSNLLSCLPQNSYFCIF
jgi:ABC-type long-subunit fatty acid transport system fused permease/ATPase subunit